MEKQLVMKKLLATAAFAALIASPAFAENPAPRHHVQHAPAASSQASQAAPFGRTETRPAHSANAANDVYNTTGRYVGSDPDARVRLDLLRDETTAD
jgi:hypothetical protein